MSNSRGRGAILDLTLYKFDFFDVLKRIEDKITPNSKIKKHIRWLCKCRCGEEFTTTTKQIRKGRKSCGCKSLCNRFVKTLSPEDYILNKVISHYKVGAKQRDLYWELSREYAVKLLLDKCKYCGVEPNKSYDYFYKFYKTDKPLEIRIGGIDRVDSNLGYTEDNTVSCCIICNRAKSDLSLQEFKIWIDRLIEHRSSNNG